MHTRLDATLVQKAREKKRVGADMAPKARRLTGGNQSRAGGKRGVPVSRDRGPGSQMTRTSASVRADAAGELGLRSAG